MEPFNFFSDHGNAKGELQLMYEIQKSDRSPEEKKRVVADMLAALKNYGFRFSEYLIYDFEHKTPEEQHEYISDKEHVSISVRLNTPEVVSLIESKIETYEKYKQFFRRGICFVTEENKAEFLSFVYQYPALFIKPNDDWGGSNARTADLADYSDADALLTELLAQYPKGFLAEERLTNAEPFYSLHPGSLNTVRMPTIRLQDGVRVIHPFVRIGRGNAVVDNAASGGIMALVDVETGIITAAKDETDVSYDYHPDTGIPIVGFRIPEWEEAKKLACELAMVLDDMHYCGWDLAYTPKGWVMIEGNSRGQFVWQMVDKIGCRTEFEAYLREVCGE